MFISKPSFDGLIDSSVLVRQHADRLEAAELERRNREFETKVRETLAKLPTSSSDCVTRWTIDATGVEGSYLMRIAGRIKILGYEVQMHDSSMVVKLPTEKAEKVTGESWSPAREHQDVIERVALGRFSDLAASLQTYFLESPRGTYKTSFNLLSPADQVCWKWLRELLGGQGYSVRESDFRIITSSDVPENMGMIGNITFHTAVSRVDEQFPLVELQDDEAADFPPGQRLALEMHLSQVAWEFNQGKEQASLLFPETEGWPPSTTSRCVGILRRAGYPYAARDPERPKERIVVWKEEPPKAEEPKTE